MDCEADSAHYSHMKHIYLQMLAGLVATVTISTVATYAQAQGTSNTTDVNWNDQPQTKGEWTYTAQPHETYAHFGVDRPNRLFIIRCDLRTRQVGIARFLTSEANSRSMVIRTETTMRQLVAEPLPNVRPLAGVELAANDPLFDAMAITQGRFAIEVEREEPLYLPAWAEVTRVIEDCR